MRSGRRRKVLWSAFQLTGQTLAAGTSITPQDILAPLEAAGVGFIGGTVMRTHLALNLSEATADSTIAVVTGTIVFDRSVVTPSIPNVNFGVSGMSDDWAHYRYLSPGLAPNSVVIGSTVLYGAEYDVRSRRRIHEMNDSYFFCLHNFGSGNLTWGLLARTLVALP
jgi:hypothetical protein